MDINNIANADAAFVSKASGVGKKSAERVIVDLRDKVGIPSHYGATVVATKQAAKNEPDEALDALIALGFPLKEATAVGGVMGTKLVLNEMVAYFDLTHLSTALSDKAFLIACFALCNFANFGSVAIQLGGIGELAPNQRKNLARLGL